MTHETRMQQLEHWRIERMESEVDAVTVAVREHRRNDGLLQDMRSTEKETILRNARFIGCTTTGAASYKDLLDGAC